MITRRNVVVGSLALAMVGQPTEVRALNLCPPNDLPPGNCSAMLDPERFVALAVPSMQRNSQWCWAACMEMVCRWYGIALSQETIVERIYGGQQNMPADDQHLTSALNSNWESDDGTRLRIRARVFSPSLGMGDVDNSIAIRDLADDRPLINGSRTHATVVARMDYFGDEAAPQVSRVHVIDPWPGAAQAPLFARFLEPDEMSPVQFGGSLRYLASIYID